MTGGANPPISWFPLLDVQPGVRLGLSGDLRWAVETSAGLVLLNETAAAFTGLLPLLEWTPSQVHASVVRGLSEQRLPQSFAETFPADDLVTFGLSAWGKHWPVMALKWAEMRPHSKPIEAVLGRLVQHGRTQEIRHGAKRLFARWNRRVQ